MLDLLVALARSFVVFAIGYLSRPLGGLILSHVGDRYGRQRVLIASVMVVPLSTFTMGCAFVRIMGCYRDVDNDLAATRPGLLPWKGNAWVHHMVIRHLFMASIFA